MSDRTEPPQGLPAVVTGLDLEEGMEGPQMLEMLEAALAEAGEANFEVAMVGSGQTRDDYRGIEGLREAMADWISPYSEYRVFVEEIRETPSGYIFLVRQVGRTKHGGVDVENAGATVFKGEGGRLRRVEFHLDREDAERSAAGG